MRQWQCAARVLNWADVLIGRNANAIIMLRISLINFVCVRSINSDDEYIFLAIDVDAKPAFVQNVHRAPKHPVSLHVYVCLRLVWQMQNMHVSSLSLHASTRKRTNTKWEMSKCTDRGKEWADRWMHFAHCIHEPKIKKIEKNNNNETTTTTKQKKMSIEKKNSFNLNWKGGNAETHIRRQLFLLLGPLGRSPSHFSSLNATVLRSASMHEMMKRRALDAQLHLFIFFGIIRPAICMCRQYSAQRAEHNQDLVCWNRLHAMHTAHWCETRKCAQLGTKYVRMWMDGDDELKKNKHSFVHSIWIYTCTHSVRMWVCARRHCSVNIFIASQRNDVTHFTKLPNLFSYFAHTATHANCIFFCSRAHRELAGYATNAIAHKSTMLFILIFRVHFDETGADKNAIISFFPFLILFFVLFVFFLFFFAVVNAVVVFIRMQMCVNRRCDVTNVVLRFRSQIHLDAKSASPSIPYAKCGSFQFSMIEYIAFFVSRKCSFFRQSRYSHFKCTVAVWPAFRTAPHRHWYQRQLQLFTRQHSVCVHSDCSRTIYSISLTLCNKNGSV